MAVLEVYELHKTFVNYAFSLKSGFQKVQHIALNGLNFSAEEGEIIALLGRNGAGKSTLIKIMCGLLQPSSGKLWVCGHDMSRVRQKIFHEIAVVFGQKTSLWWDLNLIDSLNAAKYMYRIPDKLFKENLDLLVRELNLEPILHRTVRQLSLGERVKGEIAFNLLHAPKVIFLDEPTIGLDILSKSQLRHFLKEWARLRKCTIFLTSHDMGDIENFAERILAIEHGQLVFDGTIEHCYEWLKPDKTLVLQALQEPFTDQDMSFAAQTASEHEAELSHSSAQQIVVSFQGIENDMVNVFYKRLSTTFSIRLDKSSFEDALLKRMKRNREIEI